VWEDKKEMKAVEQQGIIAVSIDKLKESGCWCRTFKEDSKFEDLVKSVKKNGILSPLIAKPSGELVAGHRRWKAACRAGLKFVLVDFRNVSDIQALELQLTENEDRESLSDMDLARLLKAYMEKSGCKQVDLAEKLDKSESWVSLYLNMLDLEKVYPGKVPEAELTERQAREILKAPEEQQSQVVIQVQKTVAEEGKIPSAAAIHRIVKPGGEEKLGSTFPCSDCGETVKIGDGKLALNPDRYVCSSCYQNLLEICAGCGMPRTDMLKWHGGRLCGVCRAKADNNESYFEHKISIVKIPKQLQERLKTRVHKPSIDTYAYRKAQRSPLIAKFEDDIGEGLNERSMPMGEQQGLITLPLPFSDRTWSNLPRGIMVLRVNGPPHEEPKQKAKDEKICKALEDLGVHVVEIDYKAPSETAKKEALDIIEQNLKEMGWRK
jgi:ParB family chromosome partitioning protein